MSYTVEWYIENRVILAKFEGDLTKEVIEDANRDIKQKLEEGTAPVHYLCHVADVTGISVSAFELPSIADFIKDPKMGWSVVIGGNQVLNLIANITSVPVQTKFKTAHDTEEGMKILQKVDESLRESV